MSILYFAYGSNCNSDQMAARCPEAQFVGTAILRNHCLVMRGVADIDYAPRQHVVGTLWQFTKECEKTMDKYEGYPYFYGKRFAHVEFDGGIVEALVYDMEYKSTQYRPNREYFHTIQEGYDEFGISRKQLLKACDLGHDQPWSDRIAKKVVSMHRWKNPDTGKYFRQYTAPKQTHFKFN